MNKNNCSIGNVYKKNGEETFQWRKFKNGFGGLLSPIGWAKDIVGIFNVRKLVVYAIVLISVATYFYMQGRSGTPVKIDIGYGKEAVIELNKEGDHLYINKAGYVFVRDKDKNILKQVSVGDIPGLKRKLAPFGFQIVPVGIVGGGMGLEGTSLEVGAGVSFFRYWKMQLEAFLTNKGIYIGTSYQITDNSGIGLGIGKGYEGDSRMILYYRWKF